MNLIVGVGLACFMLPSSGVIEFSSCFTDYMGPNMKQLRHQRRILW